ncbi:MAG: signal peptide peptidase SppA [Spirosomataceae bacterium]
MWQFIKYVLATIVGIFLFSIIAVFLLIGLGAAISSSSNDKVEVKDNSVLKLNLNQLVVEDAPEDPLGPFGDMFSSGGAYTGVVQVKEALRHAQNDSHIKGIYLEANYPAVGFGNIEEIRNTLLDFKKSGKFIYAYGEVFSEGGYYLSSVADKIFINPAGGMELNGLSANISFFKGTLEKLDIKPEIFKVGEFKSAVEPFIREDMSEPSKLQTKSFLGSISGHIYSNIAKSRSLQVSQLNAWADSLKINTAQDALNYKLITNVGYFDEFEDELKKALKIKSEAKVSYITLSKYLKADHGEDTGDFDKKIAVIVAEGDIVDGRGEDGQVGSDKIAEELRKARKDKNVKAVVFRINSPGGSALASDVMWREVTLTSKVKPIIASMSDYAASGGYYIAMGCDTIVAQPTTITGSIGIFAMLFNFEGFLKNKLGVTTDHVNTHQHANFPMVSKEMSAFEKSVIQKEIEQGYETFTTKAAQGRKMSVEKLKSLASGRVWSGIEAKQNGLVDVLGGLEDAIKIAAKAAKVKEGDYRVRYYPIKKDFFTALFDKADEEVKMRSMKAQFGEMLPYVQKIQQLKTWQGIQARMPFDMKLQ